MSEQFIGEIRLFPYGWPPKGWATCSGQLLGIAQNQALFSLLGVQFGGNGITNFALPDLRGRVARHPGNGLQQGTVGGAENVTLLIGNLPQHNHLARASTDNGDAAPFSGNCMATATVVASSAPTNFYATGSANQQPLAAASVAMTGNTLPHENCQPSLVLTPCIALQGVYPSRN